MKIAVLGVGSSGIISLAHLLSWTSKDFEITSIHDPNIPILGIGESTNPSFINALEYGLPYFNIYDLIKEGSDGLDATLKLGTVFKKWREHEFINPLLNPGGVAIHMDTYKLQKYCLPKFKEKWGNKFNEIHGTVESIKNNENCVSLNINGVTHTYDYIIDCTGFPDDFTDYTMVDNPVNHSIVHNIKKNGSDMFHTGHVATVDGWMFEVPLQSRVSYGYMFNDTITDVDVAKQNFSKEINVPVDELQNIEYKFKSYYSNNVLTGRILKNGNKAAFFEPMFANSLWVYDRVIRLFYDHILGGRPEESVNKEFRTSAHTIVENINLFYHGGSTHDTPFWNYASKKSKEVMDNSSNLKSAILEMKKDYKDRAQFAWGFTGLGLELIDKNFGYNYFKE
jgi:tryptophan halogenase